MGSLQREVSEDTDEINGIEEEERPGCAASSAVKSLRQIWYKFPSSPLLTCRVEMRISSVGALTTFWSRPSSRPGQRWSGSSIAPIVPTT